MKNLLIVLLILLIGVTPTEAKKKKDEEKKTGFEASTFKGLKWRSIGPAFASGRISDFAVDPDDFSTYYVAVSSGNIWKTTNNGITFEPIFDKHGAYSIGSLAMDPNNSNVVWAGTGENNHQRALGYGNGVYKTTDGGSSWKNMGLKNSRHIGEILIDPRNSDIVYVAAEGSAWGPGEERGVYKTTDGGQTWEKVLFVSENTGVANLSFEPGNPDVIYAGAEQRRRRQFTKIGGGPESAFYKSKDAGITWEKLENGIPDVDKGGMEIVVSPVDPNIVYAMFEASNGKGGVYRSTNRGASFTKQNDYYSSGQYYSELVCDPVNADKLYSLDTRSKVSVDGGKTWENVGLSNRHVDDHALWIDPINTNHFNIGGDGGIYETWDGGKTYLHKTTLPVTQFYRVNVDNTEPFYWVYGGTQDNASMGGPSQNTKSGGVASDEWIVTLGGDGFWQAIEPDNPDIVYSAYQYGNIFRYDKKSGERIKIKPTPRKDELTYRWNWDTPFFLSPHSGTRLYIAANKVFRSDDRGNTWEVISEDITRNEDRNQFKVMGKYWPADAVAKDVSTSQWGTVVSFAESKLKEGLLYVGTDDGLIQISENDGGSWTKISTFPGVPEYTYVSDIFPSLFDENVVFASFNNMKSDDFKPYLLKSNDKGRTWVSISSDLPNDQSAHSIVQDPVKENLLFAGTEFSIYFTVDEGNHWVKLDDGLPDIPVRDIVVQERENDLVIATFGRGFYIIDDYTPLRQVTEESLEKDDAILFPVKDALMYIPQRGGRYGTGAGYYEAKNPEFGAVFTYYLKDVPKSLKSVRLKKEKELFKEGNPIPQPNKDVLEAEKNETGPYLVFTINDEEGNVIRKIYEKPSTGINRINWDLRYKSTSPVRLSSDKFDPLKSERTNLRALPGKYSVAMSMFHNGEIKELAGPVEFNTVVLNNTTLPAPSPDDAQAFYKKVSELSRVLSGAMKYRDELAVKTSYIQQALQSADNATIEMKNHAQKINLELEKIEFEFNGTPAEASSEEVPPEEVPLSERLSEITYASWQSTSAPTSTQKMNYDILMEEFPPILEELNNINAKIVEIEKELDRMKVPHTPGRVPGF
ncbi:MAG: glycosyl hydrolase [Bacteroidetes bacterium]|nr:glycosyl hydrolase [Bacteroidota bacterium]MBL6944112.1 glycosyl hydrolase [Bacteroidales bacterium]